MGERGNMPMKKGAAGVGGGAAKTHWRKLPAYTQAVQLMEEGLHKQALPMLMRALKKEVPAEEKRGRARARAPNATMYRRTAT